jgi:hypothetical protein
MWPWQNGEPDALVEDGAERSSGSGTRLWLDSGGGSVQLVGSSPVERGSQLGDAANF